MNTQELENKDWEIISKYLSGEMKEDERKSFEEMLASNPNYQQAVESSEKDLHLIDQQNENPSFDTDSAWKNLNLQIDHPKQIQLTFRKVMQIAAMFILVIGIAFSASKLLSRINNIQVVQNKTNVQQIIKLSDGSVVTLGIDSKLSFPKRFTKEQRIVELKGKAFFDVAKNPDKAFVIKANNANIKVLGTSFNVDASKEKVEVLVKTGKVLFSDRKVPNRKVILTKGDFAILKGEHLHKKKLNDENYLSWKTQTMVFRDMNLNEVAKIINRTYRVQIQFQNAEIGQNNLNTTFNQDPIEHVLENICLPFNLTYVKMGNKIMIKEKE